MIDQIGRLGDDELVDALAAGKLGIERLDPRRRQEVCGFLCEKVLDRYNRLAAEPEVVAALKTLNKGRETKFAVGPRPKYGSRMAPPPPRPLRAKSLKIVKDTNTFTLAIDEDSNHRASEIEKIAGRLRILERAYEDAKVNKNAKKEDRDRAFAAVVAQRRLYVERARDLDRQVAEAKRLHQALIDDPEVRAALADLDKYRSPKPKHRLVTKKLDEAVKRLAAIDETIAAEHVGVQPDRGMAWVEAKLNESKPIKMIVDPEAPFVRLSTKDATTLGIELKDALPIESTSDDGRTFQAKRATLKSLRVGPILVNKVACVVMPESFGDSPPLLGASFLNRFVADVNAAAAVLTLARVNVAQPAKPAKVGGK